MARRNQTKCKEDTFCCFDVDVLCRGDINTFEYLGTFECLGREIGFFLLQSDSLALTDGHVPKTRYFRIVDEKGSVLMPYPIPVGNTPKHGSMNQRTRYASLAHLFH